MPKLLRKLLGLLLLITTIGLATCQSMLKAEPLAPDALRNAQASAART